MIRHPRSTCLFFVLGALAPLARAADKPAAVAPASPPLHYLTLSPAAQLALIPPAPAQGSPLDQTDLAAVLSAQATRTPAQITEADDDQKYRVALVADDAGPGFTARHDPAAFTLLDNVNHDVETITGVLKNDFHRDRPYINHPAVHPLFTARDYSYPSGHSSGTAALADTLALLFPQQKTVFENRAETVAQSRVIAGVHYPSDIQQGASLGHDLFALMQTNAAFQKDLAAAQAELKHPAPTSSPTTAAPPQNSTAPK